MGVTVRQKVKERGKPWWVFVAHNGKRTSKQVGDKEAAEKVASAIRTKIKKGDYITLAGQTPVPNIPTEMHPLLAQAAAVQILESSTDTEALMNAQKRMEKMAASIQTLVDNRVDLAPKKIKPRHSALTSSLGIKRRNKGRY